MSAVSAVPYGLWKARSFGSVANQSACCRTLLPVSYKAAFTLQD